MASRWSTPSATTAGSPSARSTGGCASTRCSATSAARVGPGPCTVPRASNSLGTCRLREVDGMIQASVEPRQLELGRRVELTVSLTNVGVGAVHEPGLQAEAARAAPPAARDRPDRDSTARAGRAPHHCGACAPTGGRHLAADQPQLLLPGSTGTVPPYRRLVPRHPGPPGHVTRAGGYPAPPRGPRTTPPATDLHQLPATGCRDGRELAGRGAHPALRRPERVHRRSLHQARYGRRPPRGRGRAAAQYLAHPGC